MYGHGKLKEIYKLPNSDITMIAISWDQGVFSELYKLHEGKYTSLDGRLTYYQMDDCWWQFSSEEDNVYIDLM